MTPEELEYAFTPVLQDLEHRSQVAERFISRDLYQIYVATLWANVVMNPQEVGLNEDSLPLLHDLLNDRLVCPGRCIESMNIGEKVIDVD